WEGMRSSAPTTGYCYRNRPGIPARSCPHGRGYARFGRLRRCADLGALQDGQPLHLISVTGWGREEDERQATEAGFDAHLAKPVDSEQLRAPLTRLDSFDRT